MRWIYQGRVYSDDQPIEINEVVYTARMLTPAERAAFAITEVIEQPMPDTRYGYASEDPANPGAWIFTPFSADQLKARLVSYAALARYAKEIGGTTIGGMQVATDRDSQAMVNGAFAAAKDDATFTTTWKAADGTWVPLDNATILAVGRGVKAHVNSCFATEASVSGQIASGAITTYDAVDAAFAALT
jgi:hypothetical protein